MNTDLQRRWPAEWEEQAFVQFTLPHEQTDWEHLDQALACFVDCIKTVSQYQDVLVVCKDKTQTIDLLQGLALDRIHIYECESNDSWARDHAAISVQQAGQTMLLDFQFNAWGAKFAYDKDNRITRCLHQQAAFDQRPLQSIDLVLEGGSVESDGQGSLLTTSACLLNPNRNKTLDQTAIEQALQAHLGVDRFLWLHHGHLLGDDTDAHIDTLARFCSPSQIAYVQCTDTEDEHYASLKKMEQELQSFKQRNGQPYELIPLPMPQACYAADGHRLPATYANFLIINGAVLLPVYGVPQDKQAISILASCFPNRKIEAIHCRALIEEHGSLHCISMQYCL